MKKIVASVGLVAVSAASGVQAASLAGITSEGAKPWSVSATLRGFYDDNINTAHSSSAKQSTYGFEVSPALTLNWVLEQTTMSLGYVYSFRYYDKRPGGNTDKYDQNHTFNALLDHSFSERYHLNVQDSFVIGQEPDLLRAQNSFNTYQRVPGDNIRNYGSINFSAALTRLFGAEIGYANTLFKYDDAGSGFFDDFGNWVPSRAGLLDRLEHYIHLDGRWQVQAQTVALLGYRYGQVDYNGNELIGFDDVTGEAVFSRDRNNRSHSVYLGLEHHFRPDLIASVRVGGRYTDFYNDRGHSDIGPTASASLQYVYAPESSLEFGVTHDRNASDLFSAINGNLTTDAESTSVYGSINHRIMPRLYGSITGQFQDSVISGGVFNDISERFFLVGLNLEYRFNPHLSTHVGYNYDKLDSDITNRGFDRNRVYVGVTATY